MSEIMIDVALGMASAANRTCQQIANQLANIPACAVTHSVNVSIPSTQETVLPFDTERFDTDTIHDNSTNNSRLTCKTAGKYIICANVQFANNDTGATRVLAIKKNGTISVARFTSPNILTNTIRIAVTSIQSLAVGDYVEVFVFHNASGSINIDKAADYSPEFSMVRVG